MPDGSLTKRFFESPSVIYASSKSSQLGRLAKTIGFGATFSIVSASQLSSNVAAPTIATMPENIQHVEGPAVSEFVSIRSAIKATASTSTEVTKISAVKIPTFAAKETVAVEDVIDAITLSKVEALQASVKIHKFDDYELSHAMLRDIVRAANDADFPPDYLIAIAEKESSFDCSQKPPRGSARGCFQVIEQTWLRMVKQYGPDHGMEVDAASITLKHNKRGTPYYYVSDPEAKRRILDAREDVYQAGLLTALDLNQAKNRIEKNLNSKFADVNLYLPHFLGEDKAEKAMLAAETRPATPAHTLLKAEARANGGMFYDKSHGRRTPLSVADFIKRAQDVVAKRAVKYSNAEKLASLSALFIRTENYIPVPLPRPNEAKERFVDVLKERINERRPIFAQTHGRPGLNGSVASSQIDDVTFGLR